MAQSHSNLSSLWKRGISRGLTTLHREREWSTALGALTGVFLLLQLLVLVLLGMEGAQALLRARTDLRLEIRQTAPEQEVSAFLTDIQQLPYIEHSVYITKEKALEQMRRKDPELIAFLEEFELENPFPETVGITLRSLDDYAAFDAFISEERWHTVIDPTFLSQATEQEAQIYELIRLTNAGRSLAFLFLILTAGILIFVTTELVRRRVLSRAEEILVEHLAGAQSFSILLPFATEAIALLVIAIVASAVLLGILLLVLPVVVPTIGSQGALHSLSTEVGPILKTKLPPYLLLELLLAPVLGWFGAWLGVLPKINTRSLRLYHQ